MALKRLLHTKNGNVFISILLGLGLASLFRKACKNRKCIVFRHPEPNKNIIGKTFKTEENCYSILYNMQNAMLIKKSLNNIE